jgi:hypothetical protein
MWLHVAGGSDTLVYQRSTIAPASYTILNFEVDDIDAGHRRTCRRRRALRALQRHRARQSGHLPRPGSIHRLVQGHVRQRTVRAPGTVEEPKDGLDVEREPAQHRPPTRVFVSIRKARSPPSHHPTFTNPTRTPSRSRATIQPRLCGRIRSHEPIAGQPPRDSTSSTISSSVIGPRQESSTSSLIVSSLAADTVRVP